MRSRNGWGEEGRVDLLAERARDFLLQTLGPRAPGRDATLAGVLAAAAPFETSPELRLRRARGQSFPDWIALRCGRRGPLADGVALPTTHE